MPSKIKISESDIFKFVFNRESLSKEKLDYLTQNHNLFEKEIKFCIELNSTIDSSVESITNAVVSQLRHQNITELYPREDYQVVEQGIKLAAASASVVPIKLPASFSDANLNYLIRLVPTINQLLLYFFLNKTEEKRQYRIKFMPSEKVYTISDPSKPIEILEEKEIQKIIVYS